MDQNRLKVRPVLHKITPWLLVLGLVLCVQWWIIPPMVNRFFTIEIDTIGSLEREWQGNVWLVPKEERVLASTSGRVTFLVQHGQWVAPGSILAEIIDSEGNPEEVYCPCGGLVSLQEIVRPRTVGGIPKGRPTKLLDAVRVEIGEELAWILRPNAVYLRIQSLPFRLPSGGMSILVRETSNGIKGVSGQWYAAELESVEDRALNLHLVYFPTEWLDKDTLSVVVKIRGPAGQQIPVTAMAKHKDQQGVLVVTSTGYEFRTVEILDRLGQQVIVNGLSPGERVVTRPRLLLIR
jgi:multidrug efflux pump subunit AcrA (membrane-fusion protein)